MTDKKSDPKSAPAPKSKKELSEDDLKSAVGGTKAMPPAPGGPAAGSTS
jgi:hypothetical protein